MTTITAIAVFLLGLFLRLLLVLGVLVLLSLPFVLLATALKGAENLISNIVKHRQEELHDHQ